MKCLIVCELLGYLIPNCHVLYRLEILIRSSQMELQHILSWQILMVELQLSVLL